MRVRPSLFAVGLAACAVCTGCSRSADVSTAQVKPTAANLPSDDQLRRELDEVLDFTFQRKLDAQVNAAWQIVHGIMAFGPAYEVRVDGQVRPALDWLLTGGALRGWTLERGDVGVRAVLDPGSKTGQGHPDQWLGYLSHCQLAPDQPIVVQGETRRLQELLDQARWDIRDGQECSWTLMALSTYLPSGEKWKAKDGQEWDLERIIAFETAQDLNTSACGGTHRMYGIALGLQHYLEQNPGVKLQGGWLAAEQKVREQVAKAREYQQPSGALSTNYFSRPGNAPDLGLQLGSTGHTLEFLTVALDDEEIKAPWVASAAVFLCKLLRQTRDEDLECGALYHAAHGLHLYRERRFGPRSYGGTQPAAPAELTSAADPAPAPQ
jgi:hypothetical protein